MSWAEPSKRSLNVMLGKAVSMKCENSYFVVEP